ncbi:MAG: hypothetical protein AAF927_32260 [Bacteroidota bacterium]
MKKLLEKLVVFEVTLKGLAFFSRRKVFDGLTYWLTQQSARLNIALNQPKASEEVAALAEAWQKMMPPDGQEFFKLAGADEDTAYTEIHLHCPLRGTGDVKACYKLMNYDRNLMRAIGGELIVLESQSNSGKKFCRLAIRRSGRDNSDLIPAHEKD